ncbi:Spo0E family sporulation regulatory protein-aspartic acid phosphatase [Brevibacillus sp. 179-C 1.1 NHS]
MTKKDSSNFRCQSIKQKIEELRAQLHTLAKEKGFNDYSVVKLSQELDGYIVEWQQLIQSNVREKKKTKSCQ